MNTSGNINLIKNTNSVPESLILFAGQLKTVSTVALVIVIAMGLITASGYIFINIRGNVLASQKKSLLTRLESQKVKESLFLAVKSRVKVAENALKTIHDKSVLLSIATRIANPPVLTSFSQDEKERVLIDFETPQIEDAMVLADRVQEMVNEKSITDVYIAGLSMSKDGLKLYFDFSPVWE